MASTKKVNYDTVFQDKQNVNRILGKRNKNKTNRSKVCVVFLFARKFIPNEQQKYVESADEFNLFHFYRHSIEAFGTRNRMKCNGEHFFVKGTCRVRIAKYYR